MTSFYTQHTSENAHLQKIKDGIIIKRTLSTVTTNEGLEFIL